MPGANKFYSDFDTQTLGSRAPDPNRTEFQIDRDRVIHSYAFRRLQAKTQVFKPGEYDFYRTRLTHTIEVAQIGRSICRILLKKGGPLREGNEIDTDLVECVCLAHDIGHPPFGHAGERTLNELMAANGGFEANAQTVRLLTETLRPLPRSGGHEGIQPTRALLDGVLKYKRLRDHDPKKFIYEEQKRYLEFVFPGVEVGSIDAKWKSIECQIVDWADEVAYSIGDVIDGARAGIITIQRLEKWQGSELYEPVRDELIEALTNDNLSDFAARKIGEFIEACGLREGDESPLRSLTNRYAWCLEVGPVRKREERCLAQVAVDLVFQSAQVQQLEYKAAMMLKALFSALMQEYVLAKKPKWHLLKKEIEDSFGQATGEKEKARLLCDYVSGMSDEYAVRTYRRLFDAEFGSIVDIL